MSAELSILQTLALNPGARAKILDRLTSSDFGDETADMFDEVAKKIAASEPFEKSILGRLSTKQFDRMNPDDAMSAIIGAAERRRIGREVSILQMMTADGRESVVAIQERFKALIDHDWDDRLGVDPPPTKRQIMTQTLAALDEARKSGQPFVPWGLEALDIVPLRAGKLVTIAARPGVGKTALALSCMRAQSKIGVRSGLICLEMDATDLTIRILSAEIGVTHADIWRGKMTEYELSRLATAADAYVEKSNFEIFAPMKRLTVRQIEQRVAYWVREFGTQVVYIDYLQLIRGRQAESKRLEVGEVIKSLREMSSKHKVPIVVLAQLNRDAQNTQPLTSHLKETGEIEEDSDAVILIDRNTNPSNECKRAYGKNEVEVDMKPGDRAALLIEKNRNAGTGWAVVNFDAAKMEFY